MSTIPFFGLVRQYNNLREELLDAADAVYRSGRVLDGENVRRFEREIAWRCDRTYAIAVNSCTQALVFALMTAYHSGKPNNVVIPTVSFAATLNSVLVAKQNPVYCDVDQHGILDLEKLEHSPRGSFINTLVYVNLFGNMIDYNRMKLITDFFGSGNIKTIEDAAQSFGASYQGVPSGKLGDISVLSFDPTKNLPNYGSGGMLLTDDFDTYFSVMNFRDNGKESGQMMPGTNSKMSESDCAQMMVKLRHFDQWQRRRTEIANYYTDRLKDYVRVTEVARDVVHAWHKYPIWIDEHPAEGASLTSSPRFKIMTRLEELGIETKIHYSTPLHHLGSNPNVSFLHAQGDYPMSELHSRTELSLPIYPELTDAEVEHVTTSVVKNISI